jgi:hypothetical protein
MKRLTPERHLTFFNLADALAEKGCALCALAQKAARDYLESMLYENVNDPATRRAIADSLGFCAEHAAMIRQTNDAFGIALLYESLCRDVSRRIEHGETPSVTNCPACKIQREAEERYASEFCSHIREADFRQKFEASDGFCLPHFAVVMRTLRDPDARTVVQSHHAKMLQKLADELKIFAEKHDYQRARTAVFGAESDAWQRALDKFAGAVR